MGQCPPVSEAVLACYDFLMTKRVDERFSEEETARRSDATLKRLLATPPDHKRKAKPGANPKRHESPPKKGVAGKE